MPTNINKNTKPMLVKILDTVGDGTGAKNAIGDYSLTPTKFLIKPAPGEVFTIARMLGHVEDSGTFDSGSYGNGIVLTNGITVSYKCGVREVDLMDGMSVITNADWAGVCYDVNISSFGLGNEYLNFRWTFEKTGTWIELNGDYGDELCVNLNDNFTALVGQYFTVQGYSNV